MMVLATATGTGRHTGTGTNPPVYGTVCVCVFCVDLTRGARLVTDPGLFLFYVVIVRVIFLIDLVIARVIFLIDRVLSSHVKICTGTV